MQGKLLGVGSEQLLWIREFQVYGVRAPKVCFRDMECGFENGVRVEIIPWIYPIWCQSTIVVAIVKYRCGNQTRYGALAFVR